MCLTFFNSLTVFYQFHFLSPSFAHGAAHVGVHRLFLLCLFVCTHTTDTQLCVLMAEVIPNKKGNVTCVSKRRNCQSLFNCCLVCWLDVNLTFSLSHLQWRKKVAIIANSFTKTGKDDAAQFYHVISYLQNCFLFQILIKFLYIPLKPLDLFSAWGVRKNWRWAFFCLQTEAALLLLEWKDLHQSSITQSFAAFSVMPVTEAKVKLPFQRRKERYQINVCFIHYLLW